MIAFQTHVTSDRINMLDRSPSLAAIGIIGRHNNPLHVALFPATYHDKQEPRDQLEYEMMLNSSLDIFEARMPSKTVGHDFGLLHALDERIALYGWLLNTGVKLVVVVDMEGRVAPNSEAAKTSMLGLRNSDLLPVGIGCPIMWHVADKVTGISSIADCIHKTVEESILHTG